MIIDSGLEKDGLVEKSFRASVVLGNLQAFSPVFEIRSSWKIDISSTFLRSYLPGPFVASSSEPCFFRS